MRTVSITSVAKPSVPGPSYRQGPVAAHVDSSTRALVPFRAVGQAAEISGRPYAPLLAQLIATRDHAAQTREKRRATFGQATTAYRAGALCQRRRQVLIRSI